MRSKWSAAVLVCAVGGVLALAAFTSWRVTMGAGPEYTAGEVARSALVLAVIGLVAWNWVDPFTIATALAVGYGIGWGADAFPTDETGTSGIGYVLVIVGVGAVAGVVLVAVEAVASFRSLRRREGVVWRRRVVDVRVVLVGPRSAPGILVICLPLMLVAGGCLGAGTADDSPLGLTGIAVGDDRHQQIVAYACGDKPVTDIEITRSVSYWKNGDVPHLGPFQLRSPRNGLMRLDLQFPGELWRDHPTVHIVAHKWFALAEGGERGSQGTYEVDFSSGDFAQLKPGKIYVRNEDAGDTQLTPLTEAAFIDRARRVCDVSR